MGDRSQVHIRVDSDRKEDWKDYVKDSHEYTSLTQLVTGVVEQEISDGESTEQAPTIDTNISDQFAEVLDILHDLQGDIRGISEEQDQIRRELDLALQKRSFDQNVRHALPPAKPQTGTWEAAKEAAESDRPVGPDHPEEIAWSGTVEEIADIVGSTVSVTKMKLASLAENEASVERTDVDGEKRFYAR